MWRWTKRVLLTLCGLVVAATAGGATYQWVATRRDLAAAPPPGRLVDVGGHRLHLWCVGQGAPAVVLDSGLGGSSADWGFVQPALAQVTRTCSYDRAGMGYSDAGPGPRTARRIAGELAVLLDRGGVGGAVVLVGASSGAFHMRMLATEHASRVAGLVLVDGSHEDDAHEAPGLAHLVPALATLGVLRAMDVQFGPNMERLAPGTQRFARATRFRASGYQAAASEILHMRDTAAEVRSARRRLAVPLVVVTGGRGLGGRWRALQEDLTTLSARGCQMVAHQSGHAVAIDQPAIVVDAVRAVLDAARGPADTRPCGNDSPR